MIKFIEFKKENGDVITIPISQVVLERESKFGRIRFNVSYGGNSKVVSQEKYEQIKDAMEMTTDNTLSLEISEYD